MTGMRRTPSFRSPSAHTRSGMGSASASLRAEIGLRAAHIGTLPFGDARFAVDRRCEGDRGRIAARAIGWNELGDRELVAVGDGLGGIDRPIRDFIERER